MKLEMRKGSSIRPFNAKFRSLAVAPNGSPVCCFGGKSQIKNWSTEMEERDTS